MVCEYFLDAMVGLTQYPQRKCLQKRYLRNFEETLFVCLFVWTTKLIGKWSSLSRERKIGVRMDDRCKQMLDFVRDVRLPGQPTHHEIGL